MRQASLPLYRFTVSLTPRSDWTKSSATSPPSKQMKIGSASCTGRRTTTQGTATLCPTWGRFRCSRTSTPRTVAGISRHQRGVRLSAVQLIQPFDADLATELSSDVTPFRALKKWLPSTTWPRKFKHWRRPWSSDAKRCRCHPNLERAGHCFPHEGDLHPKDLMAWEANHDTVAASVDRHLALVGRGSVSPGVAGASRCLGEPSRAP